MAFDACEHKIRQLIIKAGEEIRKAKGLPEEKNISILYNETAPLLGIIPQLLRSSEASKLPAPHETVDETGKLILPRRDCPKCEGKLSLNLFPLCMTCKDAEGGKYKTKWECAKCGYKEQSEKAFVQWLDEFGIDFQSGMKKDMGIKTATDNGLK